MSINTARKLEVLQRAARLAEQNDGVLDPRESLALSLVSTDLDVAEREAALERAFADAGRARGHLAQRAHVDVLRAGLAEPANAHLHRFFPSGDRYRAIDRELCRMDPEVRALLKVAAADGVVNANDGRAILAAAAAAQKRAFAAGARDVAALYEPPLLAAALRAYGPPDLCIEGRLGAADPVSAAATSCPVPDPDVVDVVVETPASSPAQTSCPVPEPTQVALPPSTPPPTPTRPPEQPSVPTSPVDPDNPLSGTAYANYSEPLQIWPEGFWDRQPAGPRADRSGPVPGEPLRWALSVLDERYPAGADLLRKASTNPNFQRLVGQLLVANRHSQREAAGGLATLVHESGHMAAERFKDYGSGRQGAVFTRIGYDWGGDNEHVMPPLRGKVPMRAIAQYAEVEDRTVLASKWACYIEDPQHPERAIGSLGIERLLEETIQYETSLLTAHALADRTLDAPMNDTRAGLQTMMRYLTTYLGHVRKNEPQFYEELAGNPRWRDLILETWGRAEYALRLTEKQRSVSLRDPVFDESDIRRWGHQRSPHQLLRDEASRATGESHLQEIAYLARR